VTTRPGPYSALTPLTGGTRKSLIEALRRVQNDAANRRSGQASDRLAAYQQWANNAARQLSYLLRPADLDRLVLTRRYWLLQRLPAAQGQDFYSPVDLELEERTNDLEQAIRDLTEQDARWSAPGHVLVADTNFFLHASQRLGDADLALAINAHADPLHLVIPIVVVDELDALKRTGKTGTRVRARQTLATINQILLSGPERRQLRPAQTLPATGGGEVLRGAVNVQVLLDPPSHQRLPINDDEIVDRAVAVASLAERQVYLLTYDNGMRFRGRAADLLVPELEQP